MTNDGTASDPSANLPATPMPPPVREHRSIPIEFSGKAGEYFGIWIVNILLSIVTVGIYSAWAKVRTKKYFHQNTTIDGRGFDYHATGGQILIGRIIVFGGFALYSVLSNLSPGLSLLLSLAFALAAPLLVRRSIRFNAAYTSWSGVRFRFDGDNAGAYKTFLVYPILVAFSGYLAFPFLSRAMKRYSIRGHMLGINRFDFDASIGPFYKAFLLAILWSIAVIAAAFICMNLFTGFSLFGGMESDGSDNQTQILLTMAPIVIIFIAILPAAFIYQAFVRNITYRSTTLEGGHRFNSTVRPLKMLWIGLSNAVAIVCTVGMLLPWARIRMAKYLAANTTVIPGSSLDEFVGSMRSQHSSIGDAYTDLDGVDVGAF